MKGTDDCIDNDTQGGISDGIGSQGGISTGMGDG
jgi:hypothetical protein